MKANEVLEILNVTRPTLCKYVKEGIITGSLQPNGYYNYDEESVYAFIGLKKKKHNTKVISYSRVSTQNQKTQLKEQTQRIYDSCISKNLELDMQLEDIGSGMSFERKSFKKLCEEVIKGNVEAIIIENKDRLVRFGYEIFEGFFKYFGTKIIVLNDNIQSESYEQELTEDLISIIDYFSMKSYSHRRLLNRMRKDIEKDRDSLQNIENP